MRRFKITNFKNKFFKSVVLTITFLVHLFFIEITNFNTQLSAQELEDFKEPEIPIRSGFDFDFLTMKFPVNKSLITSFQITKTISYKNYKVHYLVKTFKDPDNPLENCGFDKKILITKNKSYLELAGGLFVFLTPELVEHGFVFFSSNICGCCCAEQQEFLVILSNDGLRGISYISEGKKAKCNRIEAETLSVSESEGIEKRVDLHFSTLYILREIPNCVEKTNPSMDLPVFIHKGSKYFFYVLENTNGKFLQKKYKLSKKLIPKEYQKKWNSALVVE